MRHSKISVTLKTQERDKFESFKKFILNKIIVAFDIYTLTTHKY